MEDRTEQLLAAPPNRRVRVRSVAATVVIALSTLVWGGASLSNAQAQAAPAYEVTFPTWGTVALAGEFEHPTELAGGEFIVAAAQAVGSSTRRLVKVDLSTFEVIEGPVLDERVEGFVQSSDGRWIHVLRPGFASQTFDRRVDRYRASNLSFDRTIDIGMNFVSTVSAVPGDGSLLLAVANSNIMLFDDGVRRPDTDRAGSGGVLVVDTTLAVSRSGRDLLSYSLGPSGVSQGVVVNSDDGNREFPFDLFGDRLRSGPNVFDLPDLEEPRRASAWERFGEHDPTSGLSLLVPSPFAPGAEEFGARLLVYETATGELAEPVAGDTRRVLTFSTRSTPELVIVDRLLTEGSYGEFHPVVPDRVYDTRSGLGQPSAQPLQPDSTTRVKIHGRGGVPDEGVESVVLNVTAIRLRDTASNSGFIAVSPAGFGRPIVSNVNFSTGAVVGNMVTVSTASGGFVDVHNGPGVVDITVDVLGYFTSSLASDGARFISFAGDSHRVFSDLGPRLLDAREPGARLGPGASTAVTLPQVICCQGRITHDTIQGAVFNVVAVQPTERSFFQIYAEGGAVPSASSMNFSTGQNTSRLVTTNVGDGGRVVIRNDGGSVGVIIDLVGYYIDDEESQRGRFVGLVPERMIDTRSDSPFDGDGRMPAQSLMTLGGFRPGIALVTNLATVGSTSRGFATINTAPGPNTFEDLFLDTSSINYERGRNVANQAIVPVRNDTFAVYHDAGTSHVLVDLFGYYTS